MGVSVADSFRFSSGYWLARDRPSASSSAFAAGRLTPGRSRAAAWNECEPRSWSFSLNAIGVHTAVLRLTNLNVDGITPMISNGRPLIRVTEPTMSGRPP